MQQHEMIQMNIITATIIPASIPKNLICSCSSSENISNPNAVSSEDFEPALEEETEPDSDEEPESDSDDEPEPDSDEEPDPDSEEEPEPDSDEELEPDPLLVP